MEQILFYITAFCIGAMFGSFFTLAIYRIPLHQDITHKRSYCPKCNHRLSFIDMIPILSYFVLGGKCRYCKQRIRPRYVLLEIVTGCTFLLYVASFKIILPIQSTLLIQMAFGMLYMAGIIIIAGIDKEKVQIPQGVLLYQMLIVTFYIMYLYILNQVNIYRYAIYLAGIILLLSINIAYFRSKLKNHYRIQILILSILMASFSSSEVFLITVLLAFLVVAIEELLKRIWNQKKHILKETQKTIPMAFYLCISNLITMIVVNWIVL